MRVLLLHIVDEHTLHQSENDVTAAKVSATGVFDELQTSTRS
jgi:hypothetical protein